LIEDIDLSWRPLIQFLIGFYISIDNFINAMHGWALP
jgi:hypothetical protein